MRMVLLYSMVHDAERDQAVAPRHARYWCDLGLPGYLGGPFSRSRPSRRLS